MNYLAATFGKEDIVSADLHLDETSPHIHATLVAYHNDRTETQEAGGAGGQTLPHEIGVPSPAVR